jgi:hypothetical protein
MNAETLSAISDSVDSGVYFAKVLIFGIPLIYVLAILNEIIQARK